jgi:hypothetical protein
LRALAAPELFARAKLGFGARSVDWIEDEVDLGADNLRNLAVEQSGGIGHKRIWNWLHEMGLTLEQAAQALGRPKGRRRSILIVSACARISDTPQKNRSNLGFNGHLGEIGEMNAGYGAAFPPADSYRQLPKFILYSPTNADLFSVSLTGAKCGL